MPNYAPNSSTADYQYMAQALRLAQRGLYSTAPNPHVGCVVVREQQVVGSAWHQRAGEAHAEVLALQQAGEAARGATAYVTLEPCCHYGRTPPCTQALIQAGVQRVVAAIRDPNPQVAGKGLAQLQAAGIAVDCGVLAAEAQALNVGFFQRMQHGRPWVRLKLAMSLDGRTALANGASQWLTGAAARQDVQRLRARSCAILTGIGTVLADNPQLNVRLPKVTRQPWRIILDRQLRTPPRAKLLQVPGSVLIFTSAAEGAAHSALRAAGAQVVVLEPYHLPQILAELAQRACNELHVECGATLAGALLQAQCVDELVLYLAPLLLGDQARPLFRLPNLLDMQQRWNLEVLETRAVGADWRITLRPKY